MTLGFVIIRHVNSNITDCYWKEAYICIRKYFDNPILIIDDSSNKEFLNENIFLKNCNVVYDTEHKGCGELLAYYYYHKLKPFDTAVILHDSVFIQKKIDFELSETENCKFLWHFSHHYDISDNNIHQFINNLLEKFVKYEELYSLYSNRDLWNGCFGIMSVIKWKFLDEINTYFDFFNSLINIIKARDNRYAIERVFALVVKSRDSTVTSLLGDIHSYMTWGINHNDYLNGHSNNHPIIKIWTSR